MNISQPAQRTENIRNLVNYIKAKGIDCMVSELVMRNDGLYNEVIEVNEKLRDILGKETQIKEHSNIQSSHLTLFDMGFFKPSAMGGMRAPHPNFVVIAPMIRKFGTGSKLDVFYTMVTKNL